MKNQCLFQGKDGKIAVCLRACGGEGDTTNEINDDVCRICSIPQKYDKFRCPNLYPMVILEKKKGTITLKDHYFICEVNSKKLDKNFLCSPNCTLYISSQRKG